MAGNAVRPLDAASARSLFPAGPLPRPCASDVRRGTALRLYVYDIGDAYNRQIVDYVETRARDLLGGSHPTLPLARLESSPCARDAAVGVRCAYLREDTCPNEGFSHLENLRSHCTDVPLMAKLVQATSQSVFTQPPAWGVGSLGRVHHPMIGWSCHHLMMVMLDACSSRRPPS